LAGLPDEYGTLATILGATSKKILTRVMLSLLLQIEARLKLQRRSEKGESHATAYAATGLSSKKGFAYKKGSSGSPRGGSRSSMSCYWCERAHELTEYRGSKDIEYQTCGKTGHMWGVCWKKHESQRGLSLGASESPEAKRRGLAFTALEEIRDGRGS
jgi:hypothetical protein